MVRVAKAKKNKSKSEAIDLASDDDENIYDNDFDPKNPFGDDEIEQFHSKNDKELIGHLNRKHKNKRNNYSSDEEEVLAFDDDDEEDSDEDDNLDLEDEEDGEEGLDDDDKDGDNYDLNSSWGIRKSSYYSGNKIQNEEDALLEEEEANRLQSKMMKQLDTSDFGLDAFKTIGKQLKTTTELTASKLASIALGDNDDDSNKHAGTFNEENLEKISKNLSKISKKEKLDFLQQESPELFELVKEFKNKISELNETLLPLYSYIKSGEIAHSLASDYIINKINLYLRYCSHLSFYFILKSQRQSIENHPIVKDIIQYRGLCKEIATLDKQLEPEIKFIMKSIQNKERLHFLKPSEAMEKNLKIKKSVKFNDLSESRMIETAEQDGNVIEKELEQENDEDSGAINKRAINYQIEKNKGLTPKRSKKQRNPRVANRFKARKANIKHKSIVPKVRSQDKRYSGEASGIRMGIVRAVKIK